MTEEKRALARLAGILGAFLAAKLLNYQINVGIFVNFVIIVVVLYVLAKKRESKAKEDKKQFVANAVAP
ncbi:TPA: hypothetical protein U1B40_001216 [Streptococcus suis]|nr:hypothetical protein [Streptococcus suis]HAP3657985.1 hypothetical protein [Enterococcus faecalis]MCO8173527.1 hypothetical protein [Streptococcus suis]MCO8181911.1 hypothetical protein [Streptococcus suis]HEL1706891.1 hypothetical protein [Streptococcus suis]HEM3530860.1 hypothetical protein [Streptococcus suis]